MGAIRQLWERYVHERRDELDVNGANREVIQDFFQITRDGLEGLECELKAGASDGQASTFLITRSTNHWVVSVDLADGGQFTKPLAEYTSLPSDSTQEELSGAVNDVCSAFDCVPKDVTIGIGSRGWYAYWKGVSGKRSLLALWVAPDSTNAESTMLPLTDRARKVMQLANQEACQLNHECVGTEHVLLGILEEGSGATSSMLKAIGYDVGNVRTQVCKFVERAPWIIMGRRPHTPEVRNVLKYADEEARTSGRGFVVPAHILCGLLRERDGIAAALLPSLGIDVESVRREIEYSPDDV